MRPTNRDVLARRAPRILELLERAPAPREVLRLDGAPAPVLRLDGVQLASAYDPRAEAELQARLVPRGSPRATLYGVGGGALPRALLAREELRELVVCVLAPTALRSLLAHGDHADWLDDPRVRLVDGAEVDELDFPFAVAPAALRLAQGAAVRLRDLVELELSAPLLARHLEAKGELIARRLEENRALVARDGDAAALFGTRPGASIDVAGAGPSLAGALERLRARPRHATLVAVDAALRTLLDGGVRPDVVLSMDLDERALERMLAVTAEEARGCTLVYVPVVARPVLEAWPGPRLACYGEHGRFDTLASELPRARLWSAGSVLHAAVDLAVRAGAARIELWGADFAVPGGHSHAAGFAWRKQLDVARLPRVPNGRGEEVPTLPNLKGYLRDLERYIARHPEVEFVNHSREGARIAGARLPEAA